MTALAMGGVPNGDRPLYQFAERTGGCDYYIPRPPANPERARRILAQALAWHGLHIEPKPDDPQE